MRWSIFDNIKGLFDGLAPGHARDLGTRYYKELKALKTYDWENNSTRVEEIINFIGWASKKYPSMKVDLVHFWDQEVPTQFKKQYPKKLKQGTPPKWATDILRKKPRPVPGYKGDVG
tara:strand:- start:214 stop:564 length:351 start_codon:yes stop_codon:yes gene_type:complete